MASEQTLLAKIRTLPPEKVEEVENFVDFLRQRQEDEPLVRAASRMAEPSFAEVWDNDEDAVYDKL